MTLIISNKENEDLSKLSEDDLFDKINLCFDELDPNRIKSLNEETLKMIDHVNGRIMHTEVRRRNALTLLFTISSPLLGVSVTAFIFFPIQYWLLFSASSLFLGMLFSLILYIKQSNFDYPFKEKANTWRWFYHYILNTETPIGPYLDKEARNKSIRNYIEDLYKYTKLTLGSPEKELFKQNLFQLFLLLNNEKYKARFFHQLSKFIRSNILISVIIVFLSILIFAFYSSIAEFNESIYWILISLPLTFHIIYFFHSKCRYKRPLSIHSN